MPVLGQILPETITTRSPIQDAFGALGINPSDAAQWLFSRGLSPSSSIGELFAKVPGLSFGTTTEQLGSMLGSVPQTQGSGTVAGSNPNPPPLPNPTPQAPSVQPTFTGVENGTAGRVVPIGTVPLINPPGSTPPSGGGTASMSGQGGQQAGGLVPVGGVSATGPSLLSMLSGAGLDLNTPLGQALGAFGGDSNDVRLYLQQLGFDLNAPIGQAMQAAGITGNESLSAVQSRLNGMAPGSMATRPGADQFPQYGGITLPAWAQPSTFQAPAPASLPSGPTPNPELQALIQRIQGTMDAQQAQRQSVLDALNAGIAEQQANARANQPMLDAALANINSVLTGQAMSPGLQGLIDSAFAPAEAEGQRKLRQAAEEAAAARGMSLTDTPIGQPYLDETRRFMEQMSGQRAQAGIGLREQDATFAQKVREFQEGLKQQALTNQTDVLKQLGTPEQAASILGNLGLGASNVAAQEYATRTNAALQQSDQALRAALGQAGLNQSATQLALASQAQNFGQQFQQQQAGIQNQLSLLGALGDPSSLWSSGVNTGSGLTQQDLSNLGNLSQWLLGNQGVSSGTINPNNSGSMLGGIGTGLLGLSSLLNVGIGGGVPAGVAAAGAMASGAGTAGASSTIGSWLWSLM